MDNQKYVNDIFELALNYGKSTYFLEKTNRISPEKADRLEEELREFIRQQIRKAQLDVLEGLKKYKQKADLSPPFWEDVITWEDVQSKINKLKEAGDE